MSDPVDALILDLLEWIGSKPRPILRSSKPGEHLARACLCGRKRTPEVSLSSSITRASEQSFRYRPPAMHTSLSTTDSRAVPRCRRKSPPAKRSLRRERVRLNLSVE